MGLRPAYRFRTSEVTIHAWSDQAIGHELRGMGSPYPASQSGAWINANTAIFFPFSVPTPSIATKLWWANAGTISTPGSVDVGIFDRSGNLLTSTGSQTPSGTSQVQTIDIADYLLARGGYYCGMTASVANATNYVITRFNDVASRYEGAGVLEQTTAAPPFTTSANPATFAVTTRAFLPLYGLQLIRGLGP